MNNPGIEVVASRLYTETNTRLDLYAARVREGRDLQAALEFSRFVLWSGITNVCKHFATPDTPACDGSNLQWKAEDLQKSVQAWYIQPNRKAQLDASQAEAISRKLDLIAARVAQCDRCGTASSTNQERA